jgi:hypothetical protein
MEKIQKDINPSMRAILIDWLVEVIFLESISHVDFANSYIVQNVTLSFDSQCRVHYEASLCVLTIYFELQVAEEYRLVPDTLYLTVNYIDRYLSGNPMNRQQLQLLGVASMMIAS